MNRIDELIKDLGYKAIDFPSVSGYTRNTVYRIASEKAILDSEKINLFCGIFDVTSDYLLGRSTKGIFVNFENKKYTLDRMHYVYYKENGLIEIRDNKRFFINISIENIKEIPSSETPEIELINLNI